MLVAWLYLLLLDLKCHTLHAQLSEVTSSTSTELDF